MMKFPDRSDRLAQVIGRFDGRLGLEGQPQGATRDERGYGQQATKPPGQDYAAARSGAQPPPRASTLDDDIPF